MTTTTYYVDLEILDLESPGTAESINDWVRDDEDLLSWEVVGKADSYHLVRLESATRATLESVLGDIDNQLEDHPIVEVAGQLLPCGCRLGNCHNEHDHP